MRGLGWNFADPGFVLTRLFFDAGIAPVLDRSDANRVHVFVTGSRIWVAATSRANPPHAHQQRHWFHPAGPRNLSESFGEGKPANGAPAARQQKLDFTEALVDSTFVIQRGKITGSISYEDLADASVVNEFVRLG
ncbi:hypothetical protein [Mesorhizobium sp. 10J20-29]